MGTAYEQYQQAKSEREAAEQWNDLPNGRKYMESKFQISVAHCSIKLTRAGQQAAGGKNYWETEKAFNGALLTVIARHPEIIEEAIEELRIREKLALLECQAFAQGILDQIQSDTE